MTPNLLTVTRNRITLYCLLLTILVWLYYLLPETAIPPHDLSAHIMMEFAAAILAVVGGVLAMVRFYTKNNNTYLFIGIGLLGAGLLDIYYVTTLLRETQGLFNSPTHAMFAWTWNLSRTFLAVLLLISWLQWYREKKTRGINPSHSWLYCSRSHYCYPGTRPTFYSPSRCSPANNLYLRSPRNLFFSHLFPLGFSRLSR